MNTFHFAIKLSVITEELLLTLLEADVRIIVDAEYDRLDHWVQSLDVSREKLEKMIYTVQVSRKDAEDQVDYFQREGLDVLLVRGHPAYIKEADWSISKLSRMWDTYSCTKLLGITKYVRDRMRTSRVVRDRDVLELLGYQRIKGSKLYTFLALDGVLSDAAVSYLERRSGDGRFILRNEEEISDLSTDHHLVYYIDHRDDLQYMGHFLRLLSKQSILVTQEVT